MQGAPKMKKLLSIAIASTLCAGHALASPAQEQAELMLENREIMVNNTSKILFQLQTAVVAYYLENQAWPSVLSQITSGSEPFYNGSLTTALGTFSSDVSGNSFLLNFSARNSNEDTLTMVQSVADLAAAPYKNGTFSFVVPKPQTIDVVNNMLSRTTDVGGANAMLTDLHMGGNNIDDIRKFFALDVELTGAAKANSLDANELTTESLQSLNVTTVDAAFNNVNFEKFAVNSNVTTNDFTAKSVNVANSTIGGSIDVDEFDFNSLKATKAEIKTVVGDTAEIENAVFNIQTQTTSLTVDQKLEADSGEVDVIRGYNQSPIQFASSVNFNDVTLNGGLELNSDFIVNHTASLSEFGAQSLDVKGTTNVTTADVGGGFTVNGQAAISNGARLYKNLTARDVFATSVDFSSTVTAAQGVEVDGQLRVGNRIVQNGQVIASSTELYDKGRALSSQLLGKNATAYDADKIDSFDSSQIAQRGTENTFSGTQTFQGTVSVAGNVYVGGKLVVDSDGYLYDGGQAVRNLYASKNEAADAYAAWDSEINALENRLRNEVSQLKSDHAQVGSLLAQAEIQAASQRDTLSNIERTLQITSDDRELLEDRIHTIQVERQNQQSELTTAIVKLNTGPKYKTRTCTITTTRTETGVNSGQFTVNVVDGCSSSWKTPETRVAQYGQLN